LFDLKGLFLVNLFFIVTFWRVFMLNRYISCQFDIFWSFGMVVEGMGVSQFCFCVYDSRNRVEIGNDYFY
jgi:hypothetical protein